MDSKVILKNRLEAVISPACQADAQELLKCFKSVAEEDKFVLSTLADVERIAPNIEKGKALMQSVVKWAKENQTIEKLALSVFADNMLAIRLYEKLGFLTEC